MTHFSIALLFAYGLSAWGSFCNVGPWALLAVARWREQEHPRLREPIMIFRVSIMLGALALFFGTWTTASDIMAGGVLRPPYISFFGWLHTELPLWSRLLWVGAFVVSEAGFLWGAACRSRDIGELPWSFRLYVAGAVLWSGYCLWRVVS